MMRASLLVAAGLILASCGSRNGSHADRPTNGITSLRPARPADSAEIAGISRYLPPVLPAHRITDTDIVRGIGGTWASLHCEAESGAAVSRAGLSNSVSAALLAAGWARDTCPDSPYVLSREYDIADDDLFFRRGPLEGDPAHLFYKLAVHIDSTGRAVDLYFTRGW